MKQVKILDITVDIHDGPIGISLSGGVDSSLLLYILMSNSDNPIHIFTCAVDNKNRSTIRSSTNVVNTLINKTNNYNVFHHFHYVKEVTTLEILFKQQLQFLKNQTINMLYTAITNNPPLDVQNDFKSLSTENEERHPLIQKDVYEKDILVYKPFVNINKKAIAKLYKELNLIEDLLPVTRSCESLELSEGHCGECWWCEERNWAFRVL